ncbi:hypothetical protein AB0D47_20290 [Streptomyces sp. NPDC048376]|uniref:hypothetical protein n=1 Tax=Streptomyces sp. NPDC048376 TaxID=3154926 RepID=UPI00342AEB37
MTTEPVAFHRVIVRAPSVDMFPDCQMAIPPADAFDPVAVRITPVAEVRAGDTIVGTIQPHYGPLLEVLDRAQWVCWTSHKTKPQSADAHPFDPAHCYLCTHNFRNAGRDRSCWTVDGCTTYQPDSLLLVIPRELAT